MEREYGDVEYDDGLESYIYSLECPVCGVKLLGGSDPVPAKCPHVLFDGYDSYDWPLGFGQAATSIAEFFQNGELLIPPDTTDGAGSEDVSGEEDDDEDWDDDEDDDLQRLLGVLEEQWVISGEHMWVYLGEHMWVYFGERRSVTVSCQAGVVLGVRRRAAPRSDFPYSGAGTSESAGGGDVNTMSRTAPVRQVTDATDV